MDTIGYKMDIPKRIEEKLDFPLAQQHRIMGLLSVIDSFKGSWAVLEQTQGTHLKELRKIATIESTGSSTRIEGVTLNDAEVEKLMKSIKINRLEKREEQEVVGYYEALEVILDNYSDIPLTQSYIHQLHGLLLQYSDKDHAHRGKFKQLSNQVVARYPDGTQRTIFKTTEPYLTAQEMEALLLWTNNRLEAQDVHPILIVSTFVYEFLSIHPYQDGNGRLSRLLTTLLLLKLDYRFVQYVSFEHVIERKKEGYYRALMEGQKNRHSPEERIDEWTFFFLERLNEMVQRLQVKYQQLDQLKFELNERQKQIVSFVQSKPSAQILEIEMNLSAYSRNTLKKDLSFLVSEGILLRSGAGRGVRYHFRENR